MRKKLFRCSAFSITVGLIIAFLFAMPLVQNVHLDEVKSHLRTTLMLLGSNSQEAINDPEAFANRYAELLTDDEYCIRISIMDLEGNVIGESATEEQVTENHANRPEVKKAMQSGWGFDRRASNVVSTSFYYAAYQHDGLIFRAAIPLVNLRQAETMLWGCALIGVFFGFVTALFTAQFLTNRFAKPINSLISAAREVTEGDFTVRAMPAPDELGELSSAFNVMTENLYTVHRDLEINHDRLNSVLQGMDDGVIAVDENKKILLLTARARELLGLVPAGCETLLECGTNYLYIEELLDEANRNHEAIKRTLKVYRTDDESTEEKILQVYATPIFGKHSGSTLAVIADVTRVRQLEQMRSEFVANVTHELKTPLTSIKGYIELLRGGARDPETCEQFYDIIEIEAERLQNLINDLLELSVIENGVREEEPLKICIAEEANEVLERLSPIAAKSEVGIRTQIDETLCVNANPNRINQLLSNLLDNAIKYNRKGGEIELTIRRERGKAVIRVRDTGIGIPTEHFERIFERFYRVDKGRSRELGGTGLGLSIVKHIVVLYGGDISVESVPEKGTEFIVRLPL